MRTALLVTAALGASAGCYSPSIQDCELQCGAGNSCPAPLTCTLGMCRDRGETGTCSADQPDAPERDAGVEHWTVPVPVAGIPLGFHDPSLRGDMLEMFLSQGMDIYHALLGTDGITWLAPTVVTEIMQVGPYSSPNISFDGLQLYISRISGPGANDISRCTRLQFTAQFTGLLAVTTLNSPFSDSGGSTTADKRTLALTSDRDGVSADLFEATFQSNGTPQVWNPPRAMTELDSPSADNHAVFDGTGLRVVFASNRSGNFDLYMARRASTSVPFDPPEPIVDINSAVADQDPWLSPDGTTIFFGRATGANSQIMMSTMIR